MYGDLIYPMPTCSSLLAIYFATEFDDVDPANPEYAPVPRTTGGTT